MHLGSLEKLRIPKAIASPPESLKSLQIFETLSSFIVQKTFKKPEQLKHVEHKKEMLETLKTQHNDTNQEHLKKKKFKNSKDSVAPRCRA